MADDYVTRNEFSLLKSNVDNLGQRIDSIDKDGTRGMLALQSQMTDVVKDVAEVKLDLTNLKTDVGTRFDNVGTRFDKLAEERESDRRDRANGRRWAISAIIAGAASLGGLYGMLADILSHIH